jgi:hypothetical protein
MHVTELDSYSLYWLLGKLVLALFQIVHVYRKMHQHQIIYEICLDKTFI